MTLARGWRLASLVHALALLLAATALLALGGNAAAQSGSTLTVSEYEARLEEARAQIAGSQGGNTGTAEHDAETSPELTAREVPAAPER